MTETAKDLAQSALDELTALADSYDNPSAMYRELGVLADLSFQTIRQFHIGKQPNPSINTLDRIMGALRTARRLKAA